MISPIRQMSFQSPRGFVLFTSNSNKECEPQRVREKRKGERRRRGEERKRSNLGGFVPKQHYNRNLKVLSAQVAFVVFIACFKYLRNIFISRPIPSVSTSLHLSPKISIPKYSVISWGKCAYANTHMWTLITNVTLVTSLHRGQQWLEIQLVHSFYLLLEEGRREEGINRRMCNMLGLISFSHSSWDTGQPSII